MAETFLFNVAEKVLGNLGSIVAQEVSLAWGLKREFIKLQDTISTIQAVLLDAEEKQANDHQLTDWLGKLKDALYDAEDVLDEFQYEALRSVIVKRGGIRRKVRHFFSRSNRLAFSWKMGHKIKEVSEKLDEIAAQKAKFHLTERYVDRLIMHRDREMTHSFVRPSDVIGRDVDKKNIIRRLLMHPDDGENVSIIPIVGIGGLGKTTLAKLVYNDEALTGHFDLKMWVCVSEDFDVAKLTKEICKSAIGEHGSVDGLTIDQLQTKLRSTLDDKKYLLIMDDVWNDDLGKWAALKELLLGGANGSKIVVTTRSQSVASSVMGSVPAYDLKGLRHEDCMSLFVKWAFKKGEDKQHSNLLKIGDEIVKKCRGVPLAVRTLGSLLYLKIEERDWLFIRDNDIWKIDQKEDYILPALMLSYDQMPSYLRQCFAYCSIFPKDFQFNSYELTQLWMALGLLQSSNENEYWEDVGHRYIVEFWSRSFFQDFEDHNTILVFKMHDLVHDLALSVAQSECLSINFHTHDISRRIRHVSFFEGGMLWEKVPRFLVDQKNVRTVFFPTKKVVPTISFVETCISRFRYLRVLDLSFSSLEALPSSIGNLKHLRYLDMYCNRSIKKLPNSICKLHNLQTLRLSGCSELEELPRDIGNLISLGSLEISTKQVSLRKEGIGSLISLQCLCIGECANLKSIGEWMQCFTVLRTLVINECESLEESLLCIMKYLTNLETLAIANCGKINLMECGEDIRGLNFNLRSLFIRGLPQLVALPRWLQGAANTLQSILIVSCENLASLPEWLQNLKSLKKLEIRECPKLSVLPEAMHQLSALRHLEITYCFELSIRCQREIGEDWPKIAHIPEIIVDGEKINSIYD